VYYRTASNMIQKRVDTVGTWQDLMGGTPVPPTSPAFNAPAFLRMYNFSEWWSYNPGGVEYTRRNNSDGTCASYFVRSGLGGPNVRWEAYSRVDGATTSVEMDGADAYADWGPAADGVTRINASLYKFNETCGPYAGNVESAMAVDPRTSDPLRRTTRLQLMYNNHQSAAAWSTARYTSVRHSNSSRFVVPVNMDWVAFDIADKFVVPSGCESAPEQPLQCLYNATESGVKCSGGVLSPYGLTFSSACLAPLFPEGSVFPAPPVGGVPSAVRVAA